jgi:hypothetical protein
MGDPVAVVHGYFEAVRARDLDALCALFHADADVLVGGGHHTGIRAITEFYASAFAADPPNPAPGPLLVAGEVVAVEIVNHRASGAVVELADFFTVEDGRIRRLRAYYLRRPTSGDTTASTGVSSPQRGV